MLAKLRAALTRLAERLSSDKALLAKARRRHKKFRERAEREHKRQIKAEEERNFFRREDKGFLYYQIKHATERADRAEYRAVKSRNKSQYWLGRIKLYVARIDKLEKSVGGVEADIAKWKKEHGVSVSGNKVTGGTARQRLRVAIHRSALNYRLNKQPGYYSQSGLYPAYDHTIVKMPYGHRFDCSSFADGIYCCCGLKDPSGGDYKAGGYTGTEGAHGKQVSVAQAQTGDLVLYGPYPHHHVEVVDDPNRQTTIGHGSPPIDQGVFNLFGDNDFIIRSYL